MEYHTIYLHPGSVTQILGYSTGILINTEDSRDTGIQYWGYRDTVQEYTGIQYKRIQGYNTEGYRDTIKRYNTGVDNDTT